MAKDVFIHTSAIVDEGAQVGSGTKIWHFTHVMPQAEIGQRCILGQNVFVGNHAKIGHGVKIQNNVSVYEGVEIGDDVFVGPSVVFTNVMNPRAHVERKNEFRKTIIDKGVSIGANATIICGIEIGTYAFIGAGAVVTKDIPAYAQVTGNPAKISGWRSQSGAPLIFIDGRATCPESNTIYKLHENKVEQVN